MPFLAAHEWVVVPAGLVWSGAYIVIAHRLGVILLELPRNPFTTTCFYSIARKYSIPTMPACLSSLEESQLVVQPPYTVIACKDIK